MKKIFLFAIALAFTGDLLYAQIYIAPDGDDLNPGTIAQPFGTLAKAVAVVQPGDTIYVRGGSYSIISPITISSSKSGFDSLKVTLTAFQDEVPLFDFSAQPFSLKGLSLRADYWHIRGLQIKGAGDNGMEINGGSNNIIENCAFYENRDTGLQLSNGASNNQIINCDSYFNADPPDYGDADGFAPKLTVGSGNNFYGCRAWGNCDDGWDGYLRGANDVTTTLENCWTWGNGYLKDGTDPGSQANGNGFKMGGGDNSNSERLMHHMILIKCVAFGNKNKGFDQNNNLGSMTLLNCSGYANLAANYRIQRTLNSGQNLTIKNSLSFEGNVQLGNFAIQEANSWLANFVVTSEDFVSLAAEQAAAPRQADGSLPEFEFLHLAQGSDLIDGGVDLGYAFKGTAPDLGAFESDYITSISDNAIPESYHIYQNYPNPFNPNTTIQFQLADPDKVRITIYNALGEQVAVLYDGYLASGTHKFKFNADGLATGTYFYRIETQSFSHLRKMMLVK